MKVMVFAEQENMVRPDMTAGTHKPHVLLTVETREKLYDMHISTRGIVYFLNSREVEALPNCPSKTVLQDFYTQHKEIIDQFLNDPSNKNWLKVKNLNGV